MKKKCHLARQQHLSINVWFISEVLICCHNLKCNLPTTTSFSHIYVSILLCNIVITLMEWYSNRMHRIHVLVCFFLTFMGIDAGMSIYNHDYIFCEESCNYMSNVTFWKTKYIFKYISQQLNVYSDVYIQESWNKWRLNEILNWFEYVYLDSTFPPAIAWLIARYFP